MTKDDYVAQGHYTPCLKEYGCHNPLQLDAVCIGALICKDAFPELDPEAKDRLERLVREIDGSDSRTKLMCIPACLGGYGGGREGDDLAKSLGVNPWSGKIIILANSDPNGMSTCITDEQGIISSLRVFGDENEIVVRPISPTNI
jgi:hypothetical protein